MIYKIYMQITLTRYRVTRTRYKIDRSYRAKRKEINAMQAELYVFIAF